MGDFPGNPVIKTRSSNAGDVALIPGWGAKTPHALSNIVTNSIKNFKKMVYIKKYFLKKLKDEKRYTM